MEKPAASFRSLPAELRLRILRETHLGPPDTGGYDSSFQCLRIRDGKIIPRHLPMSEPPPESVWSVFVLLLLRTSGLGPLSLTLPVLDTAAPLRRLIARQLHSVSAACSPTQLYLVEKQMRREAIEVFYSNVHLDFYNVNLGTTLSFLRNVLPREGLSRLRRLQFTMTEAQCEGWAGGAVASGYPASMLERIAGPYWGGGPAPRIDYKNDWRAIVAFLAEHVDLPRLSITVEMGECTWVFIEDTLMWDDSPDLSWFRFIYDFYTDVATAICSLKGLGAVNFELSVFQQMRPWLEREVLGYQRERILKSPHARMLEELLWRRPRFYQVMPRWHDVNRRLEGSNYKPDP